MRRTCWGSGVRSLCERVVVFVMMVIAAAVGTPARAQPTVSNCVGWEALVPPSEADGAFTSAAVWDPDGPGPRGEELVVAGGFRSIGLVASRGLAVWDGKRWNAWEGPSRPRGNGTDITVVAARAGELFGASSAGIAVWRDGEWRTISPPLSGIFTGAVVDALVPDEDDSWLIAGRGFGLPDGGSYGILRLHNGQWQGFGLGIGYFGRIKHVARHRGDVVIAGPFDTVNAVFGRAGDRAPGLARWDGAAWVPIAASQLPGDRQLNVTGLLVHEGELLAALAYDPTSAIEGFRGVMRIDGLTLRPFDVLGSTVSDAYGMIAVNGELWVHARLIFPGSAFRGDIALARLGSRAWNIATNSGPQGSFFNVQAPPQLFGGNVGGRLMFTSTHAGTREMYKKVLTLGTLAAPVTLDGSVRAIVPWRGGVLVWGSLAGSSWPRVLWSPTGDPDTWRIIEIGGPGFLRHLTVWDEDLLVNRNVGASPIVERFDGVRFTPLGPVGSAGALEGVLERLFIHNNAPIAVGSLRIVGIGPVTMARFENGVWMPFGGVPGSVTGAQFAVRSRSDVPFWTNFKSWNGLLLAGGPRGDINGQDAGVLAAFDGVSWRRMDLGFPGPLRVFAEGDDRLVALADTTPGPETVAVWNGDRWTPLPRILSTENAGRGQIAVLNGVIHACDGYTSPIFRWVGDAWRRVSSNFYADGAAGVLAVVNGTLYMGVPQPSWGSGEFPRSFLNRLTNRPRTPRWSSGPPFSFLPEQRAFEGATLTLPGPTDLTDLTERSLWRNGQRLQSGPQPSGSEVRFGSALYNVQRADAGVYFARADNGCGAVGESPRVTLTVFCRGDANTDGAVSTADIFYWIDLWFRGGEWGNPTVVRPGANIQDFLTFLTSWFGECPPTP